MADAGAWPPEPTCETPPPTAPIRRPVPAWQHRAGWASVVMAVIGAGLLYKGSVTAPQYDMVGGSGMQFVIQVPGPRLVLLHALEHNAVPVIMTVVLGGISFRTWPGRLALVIIALSIVISYRHALWN